MNIFFLFTLFWKRLKKTTNNVRVLIADHCLINEAILWNHTNCWSSAIAIAPTLSLVNYLNFIKTDNKSEIYYAKSEKSVAAAKLRKRITLKAKFDNNSREISLFQMLKLYKQLSPFLAVMDVREIHDLFLASGDKKRIEKRLGWFKRLDSVSMYLQRDKATLPDTTILLSGLVEEFLHL